MADKVTLEDCPIGLFMADGELCLKTEYSGSRRRIGAYIVSSGEMFWGAQPQTIESQRKQMVTPVEMTPQPPKTMIERVARALAFNDGARMIGPGQNKATREFAWGGDGKHFEQYTEAHWKEHVGAANMAIEAMRKPTDAMLEAENVHPSCAMCGGHEEGWGHMIAAALAEQP